MTPDIDLIAAFLARRDVEPSAIGNVDVIVLCGTAVLAAVDTAAAAVRAQAAPKIVVTGGRGHSTPFLYDAIRHAHPDIETGSRTEAAILAQLLRDHHGVPGAAITVEEHSTNCGENAQYTAAILQRDPHVRSILVVQDPTMQRRTHAGFDRWLRGSPIDVRSFAPFVPRSDNRAGWPFERFVTLLLGEIRRLADTPTGYGPLGADFIDHVDIPADVVLAHERLAATYPNLMR